MKKDVSVAAKRDEMALQKYQMIAPLLDESLDLAKRLVYRHIDNRNKLFFVLYCKKTETSITEDMYYGTPKEVPCSII
jgi:hypothetical protein